MSQLKLTSLVLSVFVFLGLNGCAQQPQTEFYQLQSVTDVKQAAVDSDYTLLLGPLKVADYLQRESIVQRGTNGSLSLDSARWAGSLQDDIGQYLLRHLAVELKTSNISLYPDRIGVTPDQQLVINISRLDSGENQPAVLEAQWRLLDGEGRLLNSRVYQDQLEHDGSMASQVQAQSQLMHRFTQQLARNAKTKLVNNTATQTTAPKLVNKPPAETGQKQSNSNRKQVEPAVLPIMPTAAPNQENLEVYRF